MWKMVKSRVGVIKWKNSRYGKTSGRFFYEFIALVLFSITAPILFLAVMYNEKTFISTISNSIEKEIEKEHKMS